MMLWLGNRSKQETLDQILAMNLLDGVIVTANFLEDPLVDGLLASHAADRPHRPPARRPARRATSTSTT